MISETEFDDYSEDEDTSREENFDSTANSGLKASRCVKSLVLTIIISTTLTLHRYPRSKDNSSCLTTASMLSIFSAPALYTA
jgi:hypothetical protein